MMGTHQDHILELNQQVKYLQSQVTTLTEQKDKQCMNYQDQFQIKNEEILTLKADKRKQDEYLKQVKEAAIKKVDQLTAEMQEQTKKLQKKIEDQAQEINGYKKQVKDLMSKITDLEKELTERAEMEATKYIKYRGLQQLQGELNAKRDQIEKMQMKHSEDTRLMLKKEMSNQIQNLENYMVYDCKPDYETMSRVYDKQIQYYEDCDGRGKTPVTVRQRSKSKLSRARVHYQPPVQQMPLQPFCPGQDQDQAVSMGSFADEENQHLYRQQMEQFAMSMHQNGMMPRGGNPSIDHRLNAFQQQAQSIHAEIARLQDMKKSSKQMMKAHQGGGDGLMTDRWTPDTCQITPFGDRLNLQTARQNSMQQPSRNNMRHERLKMSMQVPEDFMSLTPHYQRSMKTNGGDTKRRGAYHASSANIYEFL